MNSPRAFSGHSESAARWFANQDSWWPEHFVGAPTQIVEFLAGDGFSFENKEVLDLGCGDGIISLGLARSGAGRVLGVDLEAVDQDFLQSEAAKHGIGMPQLNLSFEECLPNDLPTEDGSFDLVTTWSVFEHVEDPTALMIDVHRTLRPNGLFLIQIWPLWASEHGAHIWPWMEQPHEHLVLTDQAIEDRLQAQIESVALRESFLDLKGSCNHVTVDALQQSLIEAGFYIAKVSLQGDTFHVRPELQTVPLSVQGLSGVKILAVAQ